MDKTKSFIERLRERYKILVLKDDTFLEKISFRIPLWVLVSSSLAFLLVLLIVFTFFIRFTSLREYVIGEDVGASRRDLINAYGRVDSLENISVANELYLENLKKIMEGTAGESIDEAIKRDSEQNRNTKSLATNESKSVKNKKQAEDEEVLKRLLELNTPVLSQENARVIMMERSLSDLSFYSPVKGMVTSSYDKENRHFATDIATKKDEPIQSIQDGHVVFSAFTPTTGYVIIVQHGNNLISVYKHCSTLLKGEGIFVRGGEVIALAGSTGELSTGPHLHFELWYNGNAVNAEDYINF